MRLESCLAYKENNQNNCYKSLFFVLYVIDLYIDKSIVKPSKTYFLSHYCTYLNTPTYSCITTHAKGGVKLEFVQNLFDLIWKFAIWLIQKGKKYFKNSMKINSNSIRSIWLQLQVGVKLSEIEFVWNSLHSIWKFEIWLIRKVKNNLKNLIRI